MDPERQNSVRREPGVKENKRKAVCFFRVTGHQVPLIS